MKLYVLTIAFIVISVSGFDYKVDLHKSLVRCENMSFWLPVKVNSIVDASLRRNGYFNAFKSSSNSCASLTVAFSTGYLEFSVFVQTVLNDGGFRIIVHKDIENQIVYEYRRSSKEFTVGWKRFSIPVQKDIDHITVLGFSGTDDIVLLETIRHINTTSNENDTAVEVRTNTGTITIQNKINNSNKTTESDAKVISIGRKIKLIELAGNITDVNNTNGVHDPDDNEDTNGNNEVELDKITNHGRNNNQSGDDILDSINDQNVENNGDDVNEDGSGNQNGDDNQVGNDNQDGDEDLGGIDGQSDGNNQGGDDNNLGGNDNQGIDVNQEGDDNQDGDNDQGSGDNPGDDQGGEDNQDGNDNQGGGDNQGGDQNQEGDDNQNGSEDDKDKSTGASFWNTWTITLVAVGSATVVALLCVGSYYIGKIRGNNPVSTEEIVEEDIEAPRVIPRVKSVYDTPTRFVSSLSNRNLSQDTLSM